MRWGPGPWVGGMVNPYKPVPSQASYNDECDRCCMVRWHELWRFTAERLLLMSCLSTSLEVIKTDKHRSDLVPYPMYCEMLAENCEFIPAPKPNLTPGRVGSSWNCVTVLGPKITERWGYQACKSLIFFGDLDTISECDRRTDRRRTYRANA